MTDDAETDVESYQGPALVYGLWRGIGFVVVGAEWASKAAAEIDALLAARTWADFASASRAITAIGQPVAEGDEEEFFEEHPRSEPVVRDEIPGWADGDWPPMACLYTDEYLPDDWPIGEMYSTTLNGDGLVVPVNDERLLLEIAEQAGASLTRNDTLVGRLDPHW
jgi:hypothetical protein